MLWASVPPVDLEATGRALAEHPEVAFAGATTGPSNLLASVVCKDVAALYTYITTRVAALPSVRRLETSPVIRQIKGPGALPGVRTGRPGFVRAARWHVRAAARTPHRRLRRRLGPLSCPVHAVVCVELDVCQGPAEA
ncbi:Lrp/AsnC ligand binding domain-containing protein [Streptomyces sp. M19]